jgi:hypothetical protein
MGWPWPVTVTCSAPPHGRGRHRRRGRVLVVVADLHRGQPSGQRMQLHRGLQLMGQLVAEPLLQLRQDLGGAELLQRRHIWFVGHPAPRPTSAVRRRRPPGRVAHPRCQPRTGSARSRSAGETAPPHTPKHSTSSRGHRSAQVAWAARAHYGDAPREPTMAAPRPIGTLASKQGQGGRRLLALAIQSVLIERPLGSPRARSRGIGGSRAGWQVHSVWLPG